MKSLIVFLTFSAVLVSVQPAQSADGAADLVPNGRFEEGGRHWKRYSNFVRGDVVEGWSLVFRDGKAIISGTDCQPQSRVGFRSDCIPLGSALAPGKPAVFRLKIVWSGRGIHRSGVYFILNLEGNGHQRHGEILGRGGDFSRTETAYFQISAADGAEKPCVYLYVFHDGQGELDVDGVSLTKVPLEGAAGGDGDTHLEISEAPHRSAQRIATQLTVTPPPGAIEGRLDFLGGVVADAPLLPGETRWFGKNDPAPEEGTARLLGRWKAAPKYVAWFWDDAVARRFPFWVEPVKAGQPTDFMEWVGTDSHLPPLPPLPANRAVYLYYYGHYRYGGKPADLERDKAQMRWIREQGITGLCIQDNYGLDYGRQLKGKPLDPTFLLGIARAYKEAGFPSPLVFGLFAGLDKGRVKWSASSDHMDAYLSALAPELRKAEAILGKGMLWVAPVDEPNDVDRRNATRELLPRWKKALGLPIMVTVNWHSSGQLPQVDHLWIGAGDYPSFEGLRERKNITGMYCGLDGNSDPLRFRWLAGIEAWATGLESQAYWHFCDVHGSADTDLDDGQEDLACVKPDTPVTSPTLSVSFVALREGVTDLRLLCALEAIRDSNNVGNSKSITDFLKGIRDSARSTDRLAAPWDRKSEFVKFRDQAVRLWIAAHRNGRKDKESN